MSDHTRAVESAHPVTEREHVKCVRCGTELTELDPVVTTLGARCRYCWFAS